MNGLTVEERKALGRKYLETVVEDVQKTRERIKPYIHKTALYKSLWLSDETIGSNVYLKMESEQVTGSLKPRGAFNKISIVKRNNESLPEEKQYSVTTASSGNHGLACALAMRTLGVQGKIFVPECASKAKKEAIKKYGGNLEMFGDDCVKAEGRAKQIAQESGHMVYISPYNDIQVVHGQATIGLEILEDLPAVDSVFISVGGGGLISGISTYMKAIKPSVKIIGCQPINSCVMYESYKARKILDIPSLATLSDGTFGGVDPDAFAFDLCCEFVDKWVLVSENEISEAMFFILQKEHKLVEGAAAVCVAAYKKEKENHRGENIVLLMCGGNVGADVVKNIIETNI
ncbi:uncharacterized protein LOC114529471 [Dendronephthya gigantea]|uniref:uncharacterized protein LOC114529471 n=1 Tax=Dendronephthya gigantea TaxID=151771 RepID=UPI00106B31A8|nr:uncharacterized protein LOC114529471 [Dendronephthya gigantea]